MISILIVDDDYEIRETLKSVLEIENYKVETAANGKDALELLKTFKPSVVLLDLNMPGMNGAQFREAQLADQTLCAIPVILFTAKDRTEEHAEKLGVAGIIPKPIPLDSLLNMLAQFE